MDITGEARIAAPPQAVWAALIDPDVLCRLIPGCESMRGDPARGYDIAVAQGVGAMRARLAGRLDLIDVVPGRGCLIAAEGRGAAEGLAHGTCRIRLETDGDGTRLSYVAEARLGGRLARVPAMLVEAVARRMVAGFIDRFRVEVEGPGAVPARRGLIGRLIG